MVCIVFLYNSQKNYYVQLLYFGWRLMKIGSRLAGLNEPTEKLPHFLCRESRIIS